MANEQNNNQEQVNQDNQDTRDSRFDYMNQKPDKLSGKAIVAACLCVGAVIFLLGSLLMYVFNKHTSEKYVDKTEVVSNADQQDSELPVSGFAVNRNEDDYPPDENEPSEAKYEDSYLSDEDKLLEDTTSEPVYTEKSMNLTLYQVPVRDDNILIEPNFDGSYTLESDAVYAICWDAIPLYRNEKGEVKADITANSTYLITEDEPGVITITIDDNRQHVRHVGELDITTAADNLGIEFCSSECYRRAYGSRPRIEDGEFILCFYTSGDYAEYESNGVSGVDGYYNYNYGAEGYESEERFVTRPSDDDDIDIDVDNYPKPMPAPTPTPMPKNPEPTPVPTPDPIPTPPADYEPKIPTFGGDY